MNASTKIQQEFGFGDSSLGLIVADPVEALQIPELKGQAHYIRRAFDRLKLDGIVCIDGIPTVLLTKFGKPVSRSQINDLQQKFWNLGTGTLLVVVDPVSIYVFSSMVLPSDDEGDISNHDALVEQLDLASNALEQCHFITRVATGRYYRDHAEKFDQSNTVDQHLLANLGHVGDELRRNNTVAERKRVHAFLGRIIFTSYLVDRGIVELDGYGFIRKKQVVSLLDLLTEYPADRAIKILYQVFEKLREDFNGSMFETELESEQNTIRDEDISTLAKFLRGDEVKSGQGSLGFWAYDFASIPVETISAIYEKFLEEEDASKKDQQGAFYTPRHLAEMVVDEAISQFESLAEIRCLDPACGSGIFLVVLFNRIAEEYRRDNPNVITRTRLNKLVDVLEHQICGVDVNLTACRIACFSLYIAYLDQFEAKTLKELQQQSDKILPNLLAYKDEKYQNTETPVVFEGNFFEYKLPISDQFDVIVGNPPWVGRNQAADEAIPKWINDPDANPFLDDSPRAANKRKAMFLPQKQIAHAFMWKTPLHLREGGRACLLLPVQILLNKTDAFQHAWFGKVKVDRVFNLSDFRYFLFEDAIRPAAILLFGNSDNEAIAGHRVEHVAPKVRQQDPRAGLVKVFPEDRKWIATSDILEASQPKPELSEEDDFQKDISAAIFWKTLLWGSPRDVAFLEYLLDVEPLGEIAGDRRENKRWLKGKGFQPWYQASFDADPDYGKEEPIPGKLSDRFVKTVTDSLQQFVVPHDTVSLRERLETLRCPGHPSDTPVEKTQASLTGFHRARDPRLYQPPVVLINKGFSRFAFSDFPIFYQDTITGFSAEQKDESLLRFFVAFVKSPLSQYFVFHTAGALGTERDEVRVHELMRLPFPLPDSPNTHKDANSIVEEVATRMKKLQAEVTAEYEEAESTEEFELAFQSLAESRSQRVEQLQKELEPLVYKYFKLTRNEITYIEDTCNVIVPSATPTTPSKPTETTEHTEPKERKLYADLLCKTLNKWAKADQPNKGDPPFYFTSEIACFEEMGMVLLTLGQSDSAVPPREVEANGQLQKAVNRITNSSNYVQGSFKFLRGKMLAQGKKIHILKQDMRAHWLRTTALNDADQIFHAIVSSPKAKST